MKTVFFINSLFCLICFFAIISCTNNGTDHKEWKEEDGYVPDKETAIKIAEVIWFRIYGQEVNERRPFIAKLIDGEVWVIRGTLPKEILGGVPHAKIQKEDGKILEVYHTE